MPHKQNMDNLAAYPGFCFQSHWEGMPGSPGVQQQINSIALTFPIKRPQAQNLLLKTPWEKKIKEASCPISQMKGRKMNYGKEKPGS